MPLVPLNVVKTWYRKDSFVYKHFSFWFKNPLWDNDVPNGFSLCPYFWLAIFSLVFFRPFVGCVLLFKAFIKLTHIGPFIKMTDRFARKVLHLPSDSTFAAPTLLIGLIATLIIGVLAGGAFIGSLYLAVGALCASFLFPLGLLIAWIACYIYIEENSYDSDRCKVEYYLLTGCLLALTMGAILNFSEFVWVVKQPAIFIKFLCVEVFWFLIVEGLKLLGESAVYLWHGFLDFLPTLGWIVVGIAGMSVLGYGMFRLTELLPEGKTEEENDKGKALLDALEQAGEGMKFRNITRYAYTQDYRTGMDNEHYRAFVAAHLKDRLKEFETSDGFDAEGFNKLVYDKYKEINAVRLAKEMADAEKKEARQAIWDARCKKWTTVAARIWNPFGKLLVLIGTGFKHVGIFVCLLWELAKAKKQGACPYLRFEAVTAQSEENKT